MGEQFAVHCQIAALLAFGGTIFGIADSPIGAVYDLQFIGAARRNSDSNFIAAQYRDEPPRKCFSGIFFRARAGRVFGLAMLMELSR